MLCAACIPCLASYSNEQIKARRRAAGNRFSRFEKRKTMGNKLFLVLVGVIFSPLARPRVAQLAAKIFF